MATGRRVAATSPGERVASRSCRRDRRRPDRDPARDAGLRPGYGRPSPPMSARRSRETMTSGCRARRGAGLGSTHRHDHRLPLDAVRLRHVLLAMCALAIAAAIASSPLAASGDLTSRLAKALRSPHVSLERTSAIAIDARTGTDRLRAQRDAAGRARRRTRSSPSRGRRSRASAPAIASRPSSTAPARARERLAREPVSPGPR